MSQDFYVSRGVTEWLTHTPPDILAENFGFPVDTFQDIPLRDLYIFAQSNTAPFALGRLFGQISASLNSEKPNRNDGSENGKAADRPASCVNRGIRFRPVHHRIVPVGHDCLMETASGS
jgi:hypothetical protein